LEGNCLGRASSHIPDYIYHKAFEIEEVLKVRHGMLVIGNGHDLVEQTCIANGWHYITTNGRYNDGTYRP